MPDKIEHLAFPEIVEIAEAPFSNMVRDRHNFYLAGIVAADFPAGRKVLGDAAAETTAIMQAISGLLAKVGLGTENIVRCDVHLTDLAEMPAMNAAYAAFFEDGAYPARTTTQSGALFGGSKVEITCIASRG